MRPLTKNKSMGKPKRFREDIVFFLREEVKRVKKKKGRNKKKKDAVKNNVFKQRKSQFGVPLAEKTSFGCSDKKTSFGLFSLFFKIVWFFVFVVWGVW